MKQDQNFQNILGQAQQAVDDANSAVIASKKILEDNEKKLAADRLAYDKAQAKIDKAIKADADDLTLKTLQFLKAME
ncbi:hypothetical protein A3H03_02505 [Candidatus Kuenenbacteria bacterium RIFCSPLOWO2_12_FULL_42_13]|uniref:Uncharacterized protein n=5 Tax=Candidatus Kueneniibacteriota TaxID=1752740 RepID=A0A0G0YWW9_9BACT|nr:MAG: hypothetical protein UV02_C0033G0026 [Candidatus Kuenenbacteria bacterium GW2011_GWA2_42_15]OGG90342.1 MAG: hypothetical protein A3H55_00755 [Candidatus Kuenenbacteria bacterium RIFCSPLOWO2_02_FULL_42_16]OGG91467.1 MAG: hypothetical protein A3H03_02505 [Candidatus Kuenenbacteria bacterium RIFCSPLOWO2_12_FULL_42_13]OGG95967.1 MAG: hypothetical protein A2V95_02390 [Candidatus Kuenenbacteria bacterium RBG_16_41_7]OGH01241.1 MAG: hypothetical protein A3E04_02330 [Candidatus Kuenenbacteria b